MEIEAKEEWRGVNHIKLQFHYCFSYFSIKFICRIIKIILFLSLYVLLKLHLKFQFLLKIAIDLDLVEHDEKGEK